MSDHLPPVSSKEFIKILKKFGFIEKKRKSTGHVVLVKSGCIRPLVVPKRKELPTFIVLNNLRSGRILKEDYLNKLKKK